MRPDEKRASLRRPLATCAIAVLAVHGLAAAEAPEFRPAEIFTDNMLVQREKPVPVWGTAAPGTRIRVDFLGQTREDTATTDGRWIVRLGPMEANSSPQVMTIRARAGDRETSVVLKNALVGEVWLCSGQSNMFWPVCSHGPYPGIPGGEETARLADFPMIRLNCDSEHELCGGGWKVCSPESIRGFSATAYFFGRVLHDRLGVPVGLINRSRGGSPIQHWTPRDAALSVPLTRHYFDLFTANRARIDGYNAAFTAYLREAEAASQQPGTPKPAEPATLPADIMTARSFYEPGFLFDRYIRPLAPFAVRGIIWYQGESNSMVPDVARAYRSMLESLIESWRKAWQEDQLPFGIVQLPCWNEGELWPITRQAVLEASKSVPETGMVVTVDHGEPANLHPNNKEVVGERLALWALAKCYGAKLPWSGPIPDRATSTTGTVRVGFMHVGKGLVAHSGGLTEFEVAGSDGKFVPAEARIEQEGVLITSPPVPHPVAARYGWRAVFIPSLFNAEGLPAPPFEIHIGAASSNRGNASISRGSGAGLNKRRTQ